jgi:hypothetical protein
MWRAAALVLVAGLAVYTFQAIAWPMSATWGRDADQYVLYYLELGRGRPLFPELMLFRTPVAPLLLGAPLQLGGIRLLEVSMALLYAISVVAWARAALFFGPLPAALTALVLLAWPPYGAIFHQVDSDPIFALGLSLWAPLAIKALIERSPRLFALNGLAVALLVLARPPNVIYAAFGISALALALPWRRRLACAAVFAAVVGAFLGAWTLHNGIRYGDYTLARGAKAWGGINAVLISDKIVATENGPASRELGLYIEKDLLRREPYRSYDYTVNSLLENPPVALIYDFAALADRAWGWDSDGGRLREVAIEAIRAHPGAYARGITRRLSYLLEVRYEAHFGPTASWSLTTTLPRPPSGELGSQPHYPAIGWNMAAQPDGRILARWSSPDRPRLVFDNRRDQRRYEHLANRLKGWESPAREPSERVTYFLNRRLGRLFPRPYLWLLVGVVAAVVRRPRYLSALVILVSLSLLLLLEMAATTYVEANYAIPIVPLFILLASAGLVGQRSESRDQEA